MFACYHHIGGCICHLHLACCHIQQRMDSSSQQPVALPRYCDPQSIVWCPSSNGFWTPLGSYQSPGGAVMISFKPKPPLYFRSACFQRNIHPCSFLPPASRHGWENLGWGRLDHQEDKPHLVLHSPNIPWSCLPDQLPWGGGENIFASKILLPGREVHDMVAIGPDLGEQLSNPRLSPVSAYHW